MDCSPNAQDSQHDSGLESSAWLLESTPRTDNESTPNLSGVNLRKRKGFYLEGKRRKLTDLIESCPSTPQFSSTLNESLTRKFENINIEQNYFTFGDSIEHIPKYFKDEFASKVKPVSSTPEAKVRHQNATPKKVVAFPTAIAASPLKEQHKILYPSLMLLEPCKKLTPQKQKEKWVENVSVIKRSPDRQAFNEVVGNDLIMGKIFSYLSNGDLFRVSMVSRKLRDALHRNFKAYIRYEVYKSGHKINKENYRITPPNSPETSDWPGPASPGSKNFRKFVDLGSKLSHNQSLTKCPQCGKPSVVEHNICQCQEYLCGYIYCQKCSSFSYSPEEFVDRCHGSDLLTSNNLRQRVKFLDLSNSPLEFTDSLFYDKIHQSSGYFSSSETTHPSLNVKRDLSKSFSPKEDQAKPKKVLLQNNASMRSNSRTEIKRKASWVPVVPADTKHVVEVAEPSSPPRLNLYAACSKQSKKNLKRLTK